MPVSVLIEAMIGNKARLDDLAMLSHRNHRKVLHIEIHGHCDQIRIALALDNLFRRDRLRLQKMNGCSLFRENELWACWVPSGFRSTLFKVAVIAGGIVNPRPLGTSVDLEAHKALTQ